jgi:hypothetical protein
MVQVTELSNPEIRFVAAYRGGRLRSLRNARTQNFKAFRNCASAEFSVPVARGTNRQRLRPG